VLAAGGILLSQFASVLVVNSTIVNNTGTNTGGIYGANYSLVELHNSIVALNADGSGASDLALSSSWFAGTESNNIIGVDESSAFFTGNDNQLGVTAAALKLGALADNGGSTLTHAVLAGSVAIDVGNNDAAAALLTDQRGFDRVVRGTVDIGAFEHAINADFDTNGNVNGNDFLLWQQGLGVTSGALHTGGDANFDGMVDALDLAVWQLQFGTSGTPWDVNADFNSDGFVDGADFIIWQQGLGISSGATLANGDANADGDVDSSDLVVWELQYGTHYPNVSSMATTVLLAAQSLVANEILVSSLVDENDTDYSLGDLSLREALFIANQIPGNQLIRFAANLVGTITLTYDGPDAGSVADQLTISTDVIIDGPSASVLTISGNNATRVFEITSTATATITELRIVGGAATSGAGIYSSGTLTVDRSQIEGNFASSTGGGIAATGTLTVTSSSIINNTGYGAGGGIYLGATTVPALIVNSTISTNTANYIGGGVHDTSSGAVIVNSTITLNSAYYGGSGVYSNSGTKLANSIVAGNLASADISGTFNSTSSYNLIGLDSVLSNGIDHGVNNNLVGGQGGGPAINAMLTALDYHDGPTKTHALRQGSAAIDAGSNTIADDFDLLSDQRGFDRIIDWMEDDIDAIIDIGALELAFDEIFS
jgi:hypothetical protein